MQRRRDGRARPRRPGPRRPRDRCGVGGLPGARASPCPAGSVVAGRRAATSTTTSRRCARRRPSDAVGATTTTVDGRVGRGARRPGGPGSVDRRRGPARGAGPDAWPGRGAGARARGRAGPRAGVAARARTATGQPRASASQHGLPAPVDRRVADDDQRAVRPAVSDRRDAPGARASSAVQGAPSGRPSRDSGQSPSSAPAGTSGSRRARLRCTGPGSCVSVPARGGERPAGQAAPRRRSEPAPALGSADLVEQPHGAAVQPDLVDGLVGAGRRAARAGGRR